MQSFCNSARSVPTIIMSSQHLYHRAGAIVDLLLNLVLHVIAGLEVPVHAHVLASTCSDCKFRSYMDLPWIVHGSRRRHHDSTAVLNLEAVDRQFSGNLRARANTLIGLLRVQAIYLPQDIWFLVQSQRVILLLCVLTHCFARRRPS